jgi:uncharacterized protein (TIGR02145 family)
MKNKNNIKMNKRIWLSLVVLMEVFIIIVTGCKKENVNILPEVSTIELTNITPVSALCTGIVTLSGSSVLTGIGVCWSENKLPSVSDYKTNEIILPNSSGFTSNLNGLSSGTTYFVRAFAISDAGTAYGNELSFTTPVDHTGERGTVTDIEGNVYQTIGIGSQTWTVQNLRTTRFSDGEDIPLAKCYRIWNFLLSPGYCWYDNDEEKCEGAYGALYNWYSVNTKKICPSGWHVPGDDEWTILENYLGGSKNAGGKMKDVSACWTDPNRGATNESGFAGLPRGYRGDMASFTGIGEESLFWSSSQAFSDKALCRSLHFTDTEITRRADPFGWGASVRCVKNQVTL